MAEPEKSEITCKNEKCSEKFVVAYVKSQEDVPKEHRRYKCPYCDFSYVFKNERSVFVDAWKLKNPTNSEASASRSGKNSTGSESGQGKDVDPPTKRTATVVSLPEAITSRDESQGREARLTSFGGDEEDEPEPTPTNEPEPDRQVAEPKPKGRSRIGGFFVALPTRLGLSRAWRAVSRRRPSAPRRSETIDSRRDSEPRQDHPPAPSPDPQEIAKLVVQEVQPYLDSLLSAIDDCRTDVRKLEDAIERRFQLKYAAASEKVIERLPDLFDIIENRIVAVQSSERSDMNALTVLNEISDWMSQWRKPLKIERIPEKLSDKFDFDHAKHEILKRTPNPEIEEGTETISNVQIYGYRFLDKTIRGAKLSLAVGTGEKKDAESDPAPDSHPTPIEE
jgi:molecular chaperone GrpE (heat shock protein)